jgi:hypothetical protein
MERHSPICFRETNVRYALACREWYLGCEDSQTDKLKHIGHPNNVRTTLQVIR